MPHRLYVPDLSVVHLLPSYLARAPAGFPSPADDYLDGLLDLNQHLIPHPNATFLVRVGGDSMIGAGIHAGDLLVVDRSLEARNGDVVVAALDGEFTVKRLRRRRGGLLLEPDNPAYEPIMVEAGAELEVWGVAAHVIHSLREFRR